MLNFNLKAKFLLDLTRQALWRRFTKLDLAAGKLPLVSLVLQQDDSPIRPNRNTFDRDFEHEIPNVAEAGRDVQADWCDDNPGTGGLLGSTSISRYSTFVAIHQVVPPGSLTPPRLSSSCFLIGSCTDVAPASRAFR